MSSRQQVYAGFTRFRNKIWIAFSVLQHQSFGGHAIGWQLLDENLRSKPNLRGSRFDYSDQLKDVVDLRNKLVASGIPFPERRNDEGTRTYDGAMLAEGSVGSIRKRLVKWPTGSANSKLFRITNARRSHRTVVEKRREIALATCPAHNKAVMGHVLFLLGCAVVGVEACLMRAPSLSLTELPLSAPHYLETPIARCLPWCCGAERSLARAALVKGRLRARPESSTPSTTRAPSRAAAQRSPRARPRCSRRPAHPSGNGDPQAATATGVAGL